MNERLALVVKKFGGTSVADIEKVKHVANRIIQTVEQGHRVVVTVSAMGKTTDTLTELARAAHDKPSGREMDFLLSSGELVSSALLALALQSKGYEAVALTGWQAGIETEAVHGNARITNIDTAKMEQLLDAGKIVVVAGFQGLTQDGEITTLGRGGSDTTAVAIAAALQAESCIIYTDVEGVYTCDPRYVKTARKLESIRYDEMLELATLGAGVLHPRAVEFAKNYQVPLEVRSTFTETGGTIVKEESDVEQQLVVKGLAFEKDVTKVTLVGLPAEKTTLSDVFSVLASAGVNVDIIIQSAGEEDTTNLSFSINTGDLEQTLEILRQNEDRLEFEQVLYENGLAKVSIVGSGMISNPGVAAKMFASLAENDVMVKMVSTSEIKVSTVIDEEYLQSALEALHASFNLALQENEQPALTP